MDTDLDEMDVLTVPSSLITDCQDPADQQDLLLLAWLLVLYRYHDGNDVKISWGRGDVVSTISTCSILRSKEIVLSDALESIRDVRRDDITSSEGELFFRDEDTDWNIQVNINIIDNTLSLHPSWQNLGREYIAHRYAQSMLEIITTILPDLSSPASVALELGSLDRNEIWRWNKDLPPTIDHCMHDLISEQAKKQPHAQAICSWDGELSYNQVEEYSTWLAYYLLSIGIQPGQIVPVCFEKSRWTVVAVLGIMKAGGAFVLMDPSQPLGRRQTIAGQVHANIIITSRRHSTSGQDIAPGSQVVVVDEDALSQLKNQRQRDLPSVPIDTLLYLIFTSGSTGTPKGVMINHVTYTSSAIPRSAAVGYISATRVLDFASYAFDVSVDSMLCTLLRGGCLCIPSDEDRLNDISGAMRRMKVTMANMTPSVARILDADIIPSLHSLGLGGEACAVSDVSTWGQHTRIVIGYGPSECTIGCTINSSAAGKPYVSIGPGNGAVIWLVDPENHNRLMPVGAVGELLVEGPIVGQGYLNDPAKTAESFIEDPPWLLAGADGVPGRRGRLYKTGDLVRYDPDGEAGFVFVGRKDSQVKLRGQRVELGEIEHHLRSHLPTGCTVAAEVIAPQGQKKESMLVAFIAEGNAQDEVQQVCFSNETGVIVESISEELSKELPVYMVPSAYIPINRMPMLVSGKTDRKVLRSLGSQLSFQTSSSSATPATPAETVLQKLWAKVLAISAESIGRDDDFFILGGDSVVAMKLVPAAREEGLALSVADIFTHSRLSRMAEKMHAVDTNEQVDVAAFSLIGSDWDINSACNEAAASCSVPVSAIEDIYPCTPLQEILMAFSARSTENYVAQRIAHIPTLEIASKLQVAWNTAITESPILRTRIVDFPERGLMQVVVQEEAEWQSGDDLQTFLATDKSHQMALNVPLSRYAIVTEPSGNIFFVWTVHHSIYDGWSTDLIIDRVQRAYHNLPTSRPTGIKHFIQYLTDPAREASKEYWRIQLQGATSPQYPTLPSRSYLPKPDATAQRFISLPRDAQSGITVASIIRAAWALVASQYTMTDDVVFGETFTGRNLPIPGVEQIEGPLITTVPVRIRVDRSATVEEYLQRIQETGLARIQHEHLGMQNIRRVSSDAQLACEVNMGLVIQPGLQEDENEHDMPTFQSVDAAEEALHFNSYPLMLACALHRDGFKVMASFDSGLIDVAQMDRLLAQIECASQQLINHKTASLGSISCMNDEEVSQIWEWSGQGIIAHNEKHSLTAGAVYPKTSASWIVSPSDHNRLMPIGTIGELLIEDSPDWLMERGYKKIVNTGDLVKYNSDGELIFIGRKESRVDVQGQLIDLAMVEAQIRHLLPYLTVVALVVSKADSNTLVAVINEQQNTGELVQFGQNDSQLPVSSISTGLADALVGLNKSLADLLPPYMIPSVYIPMNAADLTNRDELSSKITPDLLIHCRTAMSDLKAGRTTAVSMNPKERALRQLWAKLLGVKETTIDPDDSFFRLGGDSIMAMKLVSGLRTVGYTLSVGDIFRNMQLRQMAAVLEEVESTKETVYTPFSTLKVESPREFVDTCIKEKLRNPAWRIEDVLVTTDPQSRDIQASIATPKSSIQYNMFCFKTIDKQRLLDSCKKLVSHHPILRTVFVEHENAYLQVVLEDINIPTVELNTTDEIDTFCKKSAAEDIDEEITLGSSFLKFFLVTGAEETALMIRISHAQYDGISFPELIRHLEILYNGETLPDTLPFCRFIQNMTELKDESIQYWRKVLQGSSLSILNPAPTTAQSKPVFIKKKLVNSSRPQDITMPTFLTAAWGILLSKHLSTKDATFGGVVSGRSTDLPGIENTNGPCYQFLPLRVRLDHNLSIRDLLHNIRDQYLDGSRFATLSFTNISDNCTSWSPFCDFFDSIVHHQDVEYFDSMPFAGTTCRVDYTNPHPEPPRPVRVVSYPEDGQMWCGIAADEEKKEFWESMVDELCSVLGVLMGDVDASLSTVI